MSCDQRFPPKGSYLSTYAVGATYSWLTDWVLVSGMSLVDANLLLRNLDGNFTAKPAYQTAAVRGDNPGAPTVFAAGSYVGSAGYTHFHESLAVTDKLLVRFGLAYKNSSGTALGAAWTEAAFATRQCAQLLGKGQVEINPGMVSGTDVNFVPVGSFRPCVGLDKVIAGFVVTDNESTHLEYQLVLRTAKDPRAPNSWQTCEAGYANPSAGNSERNTTLLAPPAGANVTSNMFFQLGVAGGGSTLRIQAEWGDQEGEEEAAENQEELDELIGEDEVSGDCGVLPYATCGDAVIGPPRSTEELFPPSTEGFQFEGEWTLCQMDLFGMVLEMLKANEDLVEWALCMAGSTNIECVLERIHGERANDVHLELRGYCFDDEGAHFSWQTDSGGLFEAGVLEICTEAKENWGIAEVLFCELYKDYDCAIAMLAGQLLHELSHTCGEEHVDEEDPDGGRDLCGVPYVAANHFMWALMQRYPEAAASSCCEPFLQIAPGDRGLLPEPVNDCFDDPDAGGEDDLEPEDTDEVDRNVAVPGSGNDVVEWEEPSLVNPEWGLDSERSMVFRGGSSGAGDEFTVLLDGVEVSWQL